MKRFEITRDDEKGQFSLSRDGEIVSQAKFYLSGENSIVVPHVGTKPEHRGQGYAGRLMAGLLEIARTDGERIVPVCPFAAQFIRDNTQYHDLLAG